MRFKKRIYWQPFTEQRDKVDTEALGWEFEYIAQQQRNIYTFYKVHLPFFKKYDKETYNAYRSPELQNFARKAWRKLKRERKAVKIELARRGEKMRRVKGV